MEVGFEPTPVRRPHRLPDPAVIVAVLAVAFLGLAVAKPWDGAAPALPSLTPGPPPSGSPSPTATAPTAFEALDWPTLTAALLPHEGWGVRVLSEPADPLPAGGRTILVGGRVSLIETWWPMLAAFDDAADPGGTGSTVGSPPPLHPLGGSVFTILSTGGGPIRFLGVTSPAPEAVIDLRVWALPADGSAPRWLDTRPLVGDAGLAEWILPPPLDAGTPLAQWPSGRYRIDGLVAGGIRRLWLTVPPAADRPSVETLVTAGAEPVPSTATAPEAWEPSAGPVGFLEVDGTTIPLPVRMGRPLDEAEAWLAAAAGVGAAPEPRVIDVYAPGTTAVGVRFPAEAAALEATLVHLSGAGLGAGVGRSGVQPATVPGTLRTGTFAGPTGPIPWASIDATDGETLLPGDYRLDVAWRDGGGRPYRASLHVGLLPGPQASTPAFLTAARGMARHAGASGIVSRIPGRIEGVGADAFVQLFDEPAGVPADPVHTLGTACEGAALIGADQPVIGIAHAATRPATTVAVDRLFVADRTIGVAIRAVADPVPGLTLVAPLAGAWQPGWYRVTLTGPAGSDAYPLCVSPIGEPPHVPADAGSIHAYQVAAAQHR